MRRMRIATLAASFLCGALCSAASAAPAPRGERATREGAASLGAGRPMAAPEGAARGPRGRMGQQGPPPESRIIPEGDVEILTFESEENYRKLQSLYEKCKKDPPKPGTHTVQYFRSAMDRSVQPYGLWIPKDYGKDTPCAMVVQLHGVSRSDGVAGKRIIYTGMVRHDWIDEYTPVIHAQPLGRTNNSYSVMGEQDVLEVMNEVKSHFNVDPARVFLMGHSMGGGGTMSIGLRYPDLFGALTPIDAAGGRGGENKWFMNAFNQNVYIKDAGNGIGGRAEDSQTQALIAAGAFATREVFPGMPHHFAAQRSYAMFIPQTVQQPIPVNAPEVKFYTDNLRYNSAYWITIDQLIQPNADSTLHAKYDDGQPTSPRAGAAPEAQAQEQEAAPGKPSIKIETTNIAGMTLKLAGAVVPENAEMPVIIDGQALLDGKMPKVAHVALVDGKWRQVDKPALAGKRHGLQGPLWDAFTTPFLGVYGEGEGAKELAIAELDAVRAKGTFHGDFPIKSAAKLTKDDVKNYSLILFGGPEANSVVKRIADKLPAALLEGPHDGTNGVVMIQPNPENPERYVVVCTAKLVSLSTIPTTSPATSRAAGSMPETGGGRGGANSLRSLQDYTVVRDGKIAQAGYFNNDWRMD